MAETQAKESQEVKNEVKEELKVDSILALNRYMYIREVNSYFVNNEEQFKTKMKLWSLTSYDIDKHIKKLAETDPVAPLNLIKKVSSYPIVCAFICNFCEKKTFFLFHAIFF